MAEWMQEDLSKSASQKKRGRMDEVLSQAFLSSSSTIASIYRLESRPLIHRMQLWGRRVTKGGKDRVDPLFVIASHECYC